jgi:hypothetical protein
LRDPQVVNAMQKQGAVIAGGTPQESAKFMRAESDKWGKVVQTAGIKVE